LGLVWRAGFGLQMRNPIFRDPKSPPVIPLETKNGVPQGNHPLHPEFLRPQKKGPEGPFEKSFKCFN